MDLENITFLKNLFYFFLFSYKCLGVSGGHNATVTIFLVLTAEPRVKIRRNIPDILVAAMTIVNNQCETALQPWGSRSGGEKTTFLIKNIYIKTEVFCFEGRDRHLTSPRDKAKSLQS